MTTGDDLGTLRAQVVTGLGRLFDGDAGAIDGLSEEAGTSCSGSRLRSWRNTAIATKAGHHRA